MYISGKDYLFPQLHIIMKRLFDYKGAVDQLKAVLAQNMERVSDRWFRGRLVSLCQQLA